jgi:glycosyltransferase involved in cell wall biosynthesis
MISYCITCRNRLHHLQESLRKSVDSIDEEDEVIIVDYGSTDGLIDWYLTHKSEFIQVRFFRVMNPPNRWRVSHAKNVAHMQASNPIVCNLDADNWIVKGHSEFVKKSLVEGKNILMANRTCDDGGLGRIAMFKTDFLNLGGYDERIESWGMDVSNLLERVHAARLKMDIIPARMVQYLRHADSERGLHISFKTKEQSAAYNKQFGADTFVKPKTFGLADVEEL